MSIFRSTSPPVNRGVRHRQSYLTPSPFETRPPRESFLRPAAGNAPSTPNPNHAWSSGPSSSVGDRDGGSIEQLRFLVQDLATRLEKAEGEIKSERSQREKLTQEVRALQTQLQNNANNLGSSRGPMGGQSAGGGPGFGNNTNNTNPNPTGNMPNMNNSNMNNPNMNNMNNNPNMNNPNMNSNPNMNNNPNMNSNPNMPGINNPSSNANSNANLAPKPNPNNNPQFPPPTPAPGGKGTIMCLNGCFASGKKSVLKSAMEMVQSGGNKFGQWQLVVSSSYRMQGKPRLKSWAEMLTQAQQIASNGVNVMCDISLYDNEFISQASEMLKGLSIFTPLLYTPFHLLPQRVKSQNNPVPNTIRDTLTSFIIMYHGQKKSRNCTCPLTYPQLKEAITESWKAGEWQGDQKTFDQKLAQAAFLLGLVTDGLPSEVEAYIEPRMDPDAIIPTENNTPMNCAEFLMNQWQMFEQKKAAVLQRNPNQPIGALHMGGMHKPFLYAGPEKHGVF